MIDINSAIKHFESHDPKVVTLLKNYAVAKRVIKKSPPDMYARELFASIVSQQLSTKVADIIWGRFANLVKVPEDPKVVKKFSVEQLRTVGLSNSKATYILAIANGVTDGTVLLDHLDSLDDEAIIAELVQLKGVGRWTAEMFLLFTLARPDVFSVGDLGLRNAADKFFDKKLKPEKLLKLSAAWSPHRSAVSLALWHSLDSKV
ncbi:MAG: DNA-3-methyladenine glycosylase 2 family protein [Patescibacteria group bacterium]